MIFIAKLDVNKMFDVILILLDDAIELGWVRSLEENAGWGDDDMVTRDMPWAELSWLEFRALGSHNASHVQEISFNTDTLSTQHSR
jgi:hypothetical protein